MDQKETERAVNTLKTVEEFKDNILSFYNLSAQMWPESRPFWLKLAEEKKKHIEGLKLLQKIISDFPDEFTPAEFIDKENIIQYSKDVKKEIEKLQNSIRDKHQCLSKNDWHNTCCIHP